MYKLFQRLIPGLCALAVPVLFFGVPAFAQENSAPAVNALPSLPSVLVSDIQVQKTDNVYKGTFVLSNNENAAFGNLQYQISLIGPRPKMELNKFYLDDVAEYDRFVSPSVIEIAKQSKKTVEFSYTLPNVPAGIYRLRVAAITAKGIQLGWSDLNLDLKDLANTAKQVTLFLGSVSSDATPKGMAAGAGLSVKPGEKVSIQYFVENKTGVKQVLTPTLTVWEYAKNRTKVSSVTGDAITVANGKNSEFKFSTVAPQKPESYYAELVLNGADGKQASNIGQYRWVVTGPSAEISFIRVTQPAFLKGETMSVAAEVVGAADQTTAVSASAEVSVLNGEKVVASQKSEFVSLGSTAKTYSVNVKLTEDVKNPIIRVRIADRDGNILAEDTAKLTAPANAKASPVATAPTSGATNKTNSSPLAIALGVIILLLALGACVWLFMRSRKVATPTILLVLLLLVPVSFFALRAAAEELNFTGTSNGVWTTTIDCGKATCNQDVIQPDRIAVSSPINNNTAPISEMTTAGDMYVVHFSAIISTLVCQNDPGTTGSFSLKTSDGTTIKNEPTSASDPCPQYTSCRDTRSHLQALPPIIADISFDAPQPNNKGTLTVNFNDKPGYGVSTVTSLVQTLNFAPVLSQVQMQYKRWNNNTGAWDRNATVLNPASPIVDFDDAHTRTKFYVENVGDQDLTYQTALETGPFAISTVPPSEPSGTIPVIQNVGIFIVDYTPAAATVTKQLTVTSNASNYPVYPITLRATVTPVVMPKIKVSIDGIERAVGTNVLFGSVDKNTTVTKTVTIENVGDPNSVLEINYENSTVIPTSTSSAFSAVFPQQKTVSIPKGGAPSTFELTFSPFDATVYTSTLNIKSNDSNAARGSGTFTLGLRGTGLAPATTPTVSFWVEGTNGSHLSSKSIVKGKSITLGWSSEHTTSCVATNDSTWSGNKGTAGTATMSNITASKKYVLTCSGNGKSAPPKEVTITATDPDLGSGIVEL